MRWLRVAMLLWLALPAALRAQEPGPPPRRPDRAELQAQVLDRFINIAAKDLSLQDRQRDRLTEVVRRTMQRRRQLATESIQIRDQLAVALRSDRTEDAEFSRLLRRLDELREEEMELWRQENTDLSGFLTPRQHAQFLALRARFNERVMRMRGRR